MKKLILPALAIMLLLGLSGCPSVPAKSQAPFATKENNLVVHTYSKVVFPERIGPFIREGFTVYDQNGLDVSAAYICRNPVRITATVYSFPSPKLISLGSPSEVSHSAREQLTANNFNEIKQEIMRVHPDAVELQSKDIEGAESTIGKFAEYKFTESFMGQTRDLNSRLYLFTYLGGKWTVQYRFTYPANPSADKTVDAFVKEYKWLKQTE